MASLSLIRRIRYAIFAKINGIFTAINFEKGHKVILTFSNPILSTFCFLQIYSFFVEVDHFPFVSVKK
jgi:hypothetical protein